jgi:hypothetical protein
MIRKIVFRTLIISAVIIILLLLLFPGIARRYAVNHSKKLMGRQIALEKLKINYFTGTLKMIDFKMFEADDTSTFISFDTLVIDAEPYRFIWNELVVEQFYLKGLRTKIIQYDSTYNFDDLITFFATKADTVPQDTTDSEPLHFLLSNIELKGAELIFDDRNIDKITQLNDISFFIPFIGWNQKEKSEADLRFAFKNEGYFESSINVDPIGGDFDAKITIYHLYLQAFQDYVATYANINAFQGVLNSDLVIAGNINEAEKSVVSGKIEILDFLMKDKQDMEFLGARKMDCLLKTIDAYHSEFIIDSLIFTQPYVYFELDTISNNFFEIFNISTEEDTTQIAEITVDTIVTDANDSLYYAINHLIIQNGIIDYTDNLTGEPFDYHLSDIEMNADSILSNSDWVNTYSSMLLNNRGKLVAEVGFNPANPLDIILDYVITDFQLSDLNIYSRFYMGFPIVYGDMYYKSHTGIINNQLKSENKLIIQNVELGNKSGGLFNLPLKFALFLLKDRKGVINLDIPVRGDLNDPKVSVGKIVWNTFKNLIIKVAAAPFDFLASLISVDPKDIKSIEYDYLDTAFTVNKKKQLDLLLELEQKKDGLKIELVYFNDLDKEKRQIVVNEAGKLFASKAGKDYLAHEDDFIEFLKENTKSDSVDIVDASKMLIPATTIDSLSGMFARYRKASLENYLHMANDSTQIQFILPDPQAPKNVGSTPQFEVKYSMTAEELEKK